MKCKSNTFFFFFFSSTPLKLCSGTLILFYFILWNEVLCGSRILIKPVEIFQLKKKCGHSGYSSPASGWKLLSLSTPPAKDLVMGKGWGVRLAFFLFLCFLPFPWAGCLPLRPLPGWKNWERKVKDHNSHVSWVAWYSRLFLGFFRRPLVDPSNSIFLELGYSSLACYIALCPWLFRGSFHRRNVIVNVLQPAQVLSWARLTVA